MCLTLCHQRRLVYDNHRCDACRRCLYQAGVERCDQCTYYAGHDVCNLTHARVPPWRRCCHLDAEIHHTNDVLVWDVVDEVLLAEGYEGDIGLFAAEWGLPKDGIPASRLVVPMLYGVEAAEWADLDLY